MRRKGTLLMAAGAALVLCAAALAGYNLAEDRRADTASAAVVTALEEQIPGATETAGEHAGVDAAQVKLPDHVRFPQMEMPVVTVDGMDYVGIVTIPAIGVELPVLSQWSDAGAKTAPCRYTGSAYQDNMVLAGHNYSAHFKGLSELREGDAVVFTDVAGNVFRYTVAAVEVLGPYAIEDMCESGWPLTLFTCTYGGANRVTVRCERTTE